MGPSLVRNVAVYATTAHALTTASSPTTRESCSSYRLIGAVPYTGIIITRVALTYSEISVSKLLRIIGRHWGNGHHHVVSMLGASRNL